MVAVVVVGGDVGVMAAIILSCGVLVFLHRCHWTLDSPLSPSRGQPFAAVLPFSSQQSLTFPAFQQHVHNSSFFQFTAAHLLVHLHFQSCHSRSQFGVHGAPTLDLRSIFLISRSLTLFPTSSFFMLHNIPQHFGSVLCSCASPHIRSHFQFFNMSFLGKNP